MRGTQAGEEDVLAATCMHQPGPGSPDSIDATKDVSICQGKQVIWEIESLLLKGWHYTANLWGKGGEKEGNPILTVLGSKDKQERNIPREELTVMGFLLSPCWVCFFWVFRLENHL